MSVSLHISGHDFHDGMPIFHFVECSGFFCVCVGGEIGGSSWQYPLEPLKMSTSFAFVITLLGTCPSERYQMIKSFMQETVSTPLFIIVNGSFKNPNIL